MVREGGRLRGAARVLGVRGHARSRRQVPGHGFTAFVTAEHFVPLIAWPAQHVDLVVLGDVMQAGVAYFPATARSPRAQAIGDGYALRWRDRRSEGDRKIEDAHDEENIIHWLWRVLPPRRPWPENPYAAEIRRLTRYWEDAAPGN